MLDSNFPAVNILYSNFGDIWPNLQQQMTHFEVCTAGEIFKKTYVAPSKSKNNLAVGSAWELSRPLSRLAFQAT